VIDGDYLPQSAPRAAGGACFFPFQFRLLAVRPAPYSTNSRCDWSTVVTFLSVRHAAKTTLVLGDETSRQ